MEDSSFFGFGAPGYSGSPASGCGRLASKRLSKMIEQALQIQKADNNAFALAEARNILAGLRFDVGRRQG
jgi:hypothetical protein